LVNRFVKLKGVTRIWNDPAGVDADGRTTRLGDDADRLFLDRLAQGPDALVAVFDEAAALSERRRAT
jgi:hypothetical protein